MKKEFLKSICKSYKYEGKNIPYKTGTDYLRVVIKEEDLSGLSKIIEALELLDFDNSNYMGVNLKDKKLNLYKMRSKNGDAIMGTVVYKKNAVPVIFIEKYGDNTKAMTKAWGRMDIYGMYYRIKELHDGGFQKGEGGIIDFVDKLGGNRKISRIDWKIDFFTNQKNKKLLRPEEVTKLRTNSKADYKVIGGKIQSWRLGDRKSKKYVIRAYDKLADTLVKGKFPMYADYFKFKNVHRLEFEFLNHFCKDYTYDRTDELIAYIKSFLECDKLIGPIFESNNDIDINEVKDRFKYADSTKGYMRGCINAGINIFGLLDEVLGSLGKNDEDIWEMFMDFVKRKRNFDNFTDKREDLDLMEEVYKVFYDPKSKYK